MFRDIGDFLLAGTKNLSRQVRVVVAEDQGESSLARVIEGITTASEQRTKGTESLDGLMRFFVSGVVVFAIVVFAWALYDNWDLDFALCVTTACERATTVLAAACPCGIGLATPSATMAGVG